MSFERIRSVRFKELLQEPVRNGIYKQKEFHGRGCKIVNMGELFGHSRLFDVPMKRVELSLKESEKSLLQVGDLLFARRSLIASGAGKCSVVKEIVEPTTFESSIIRARPDPQKSSSEYLYYYFSSSYGREKLGQILRQMAVSGITGSDLMNLEIDCPSLEVQRYIAVTLSTLDDRIALLRETNATLEAIAQALFKSWFVDFDPVHANQQNVGRVSDSVTRQGVHDAEAVDVGLRLSPNPTYETPPEIAVLFPDSFDESELGLVPRGWRVTPIYELATYINGATYKAFEPNLECRGLPIIKIAELKAGVTSQTAYSDVAMPEKYRIDTGDILFSWSGNPDTSIDVFVWHHGKAWLNQHIFRVIPHAVAERSFVLQILKYLRPTFAELARNKQTTGLGHVTVADMKRLLVIHPDKTALDLFDATVAPVHERMFENEKQAQTLATLRDTLLPRLISGQLRLPEAEAMLETA